MVRRFSFFFKRCGDCDVFCREQYEYSEEKTQERIEQKIKDAPEGQGTVRMLTREEWDVAREVMPRTPFESKFARANARIRTGEALTKASQIH